MCFTQQLISSNVLSEFFGPVFYFDDLHLVSRMPIHVLHIPRLTTKAQILQASLEQFSVHNSEGPDGIHPQLMKNLAPFIADP